MTYQVDEKLQKKVLAEIMEKRKHSIKRPLFWMKLLFVVCWLIFLIPLIAIIIPIVILIKENNMASVFACLVIPLLAWIAAMFLSIIPRSIKSVTYRKYLMPWYGKNEESIVVTDKYVEYNYYNLFWGERFWSNKMRFNQIVQMEYDDKQKLLRVYGPIETREWIDSGKNQCWDKTAANPETGMDDWMEIPGYFQNFDKLMKELEEKVGKPVLQNEREFIMYK